MDLFGGHPATRRSTRSSWPNRLVAPRAAKAAIGMTTEFLPNAEHGSKRSPCALAVAAGWHKSENMLSEQGTIYRETPKEKRLVVQCWILMRKRHGGKTWMICNSYRTYIPQYQVIKRLNSYMRLSNTQAHFVQPDEPSVSRQGWEQKRGPTAALVYSFVEATVQRKSLCMQRVHRSCRGIPVKKMKPRAMDGNLRASECWNWMLFVVHGARQVLIWIDGCCKIVFYKVI